MKILYLPLKKEWYEMIERGDKREEYRENTRYWKTRLIDTVIYDEGGTRRPKARYLYSSKTTTQFVFPTATPAAGCCGSAKALILAEVARNGVHPITKHLSSNLETA